MENLFSLIAILIPTITPFLVIYLIARALIRSKHRNSRDTTPVYHEVVTHLTQREQLLVTLVMERNILSLDVLKAQARMSDIELNRVLVRLLNSDYLRGYYINYRTRMLERSIEARQPIPASAPNFVPGYRVCHGCGAKEYKKDPTSRCSYCNSPLED